jgi:peptide-methionine (S)-S-oxide reductase
MHDPTQLNRQGPDVGSQYRSAIFPHDTGQQQEALAAVARLDDEHACGRPVVTQVGSAGPWWRAEGYHQGYLVKRAGRS